jgi:hypothetical protein
MDVGLVVGLLLAEQWRRIQDLLASQKTSGCLGCDHEQERILRDYNSNASVSEALDSVTGFPAERSEQTT